jgi:hypothetical protein
MESRLLIFIARSIFYLRDVHAREGASLAGTAPILRINISTLAEYLINYLDRYEHTKVCHLLVSRYVWSSPL